MFDYRGYIKQGFLDAVGKMADFQIILATGKYYENNVLTADDLAEIKSKIDEKNNPIVPEEEPVEEPTEEVEEVEAE